MTDCYIVLGSLGSAAGGISYSTGASNTLTVTRTYVIGTGSGNGILDSKHASSTVTLSEVYTEETSVVGNSGYTGATTGASALTSLDSDSLPSINWVVWTASTTASDSISKTLMIGQDIVNMMMYQQL